MNKYVRWYLMMLCFLVILSCTENKPVETKTTTEVITQPKDTLDLLSENYIRNPGPDTAKIISEKLVEKGAPEAKEIKAISVKEVQKPKEIKEKPLKKERPRKVPLVSFETQTHSFGRIMQGEEKEFKFKFKNTGNADLQIINATATCGCTIPSYPFIPIGPGEEGYIGVTYNSAGKLGPQKPTITIITNADPKTYKLHLDGIVDSERED